MAVLSPSDSRAHPGPSGEGPAPDPERVAEVLDLIGRCRGYALAVGALAVSCATATSEGERADLARELTEYRHRYRDALAEKMRKGPFLRRMSRIAAHRRIVHGFAETIRDLPDDARGITRTLALDIAAQSRREVLPAIDAIVEVLDELRRSALELRLERVGEKAAMVDGMLTEMARLGRMIGLISVNASVEAARAGGESGRAFRFIAEEVRNLARQSSEVVQRMRHRLVDDETELR